LVATDLDGTFLRPDGTVSARAAAAVRRARLVGIEVIPVTARAPWATLAVAVEAGFGPLAVCGNGAVIYDVMAGEVLAHLPLGAGAAASVVSAVREVLPGVLFASESITSMVAEHGLIDAESANVWGLEVCELVTDVMAHLGSDAPVTKLVCHHPDRPVESHELVLKQVVEACGPLAEVSSAGAGWITIGASGVTKAIGLAMACARLGLLANEVMGVGDALNDVPMLAWVGHPVAVANACPEVLALADRVVASNAADGVAALLEELSSFKPHY
jgi:Cof subfamily protein (haloacid dehalogenase superfamily)